MRRIGLAVLAAFVAAPASAFAADELDAVWTKIQPARGVYVLRLGGNSEGQMNLSGKLVIETRVTCSEITVTTTMDIRATSGSQTMTVAMEQNTRETRDGKVYRFSARTAENGRETENREGQAVLESRDGPGEAKIKGAAGGEDVKLEAGTMLPASHNLRVLAAAAAKKAVSDHRVFFGLDQMKLTMIRSTIQEPGRSAKGAGMGEFADKPGWTVREEYRELGGGPDTQNQVVETFMTEEGVATRIHMTVQGIELNATPLAIEKLPKPDCKS